MYASPRSTLAGLVTGPGHSGVELRLASGQLQSPHPQARGQGSGNMVGARSRIGWRSLFREQVSPSPACSFLFGEGHWGDKTSEWEMDIPGDPRLMNPPLNGGEMGSIPGQGTKIPPAMELLNLQIVEPTLRN